jgi:hypothetical protein
MIIKGIDLNFQGKHYNYIRARTMAYEKIYKYVRNLISRNV